MMCVLRLRGLSSLSLILIILLFSRPLLARERQLFYNGIRSEGMGGVAVATANDETALAQNPAALGRLRDFYGTIFDPELDLGANVQPITTAHAVSQQFAPDDVIPAVVASPGSYYHARMQLFPSFVAKNFGIGLLGNYTMDANATSSTSVDTFFRDDLALLLGYNLRLFGGRIKIGFTGKAISRIEMNEANLNPSTQNLDKGSLAAAGLLKEGLGVGADVGVLLAAPWVWIPTLGAVVRDVGGTAFTQSSGVRRSDTIARPTTQAQDMDVAVSISPIHTNSIRSTWSLEYKGVLTASSEPDKAKLLHAGGEINFGDVFFFRVGYNERYYTAGAELASEHFQFQLATYGEEVGDATTPVEDRRYVAKISFRF